jgi:hypothetical protein
MASWRPLTREPDAIRATIYDYLRNRAAQVFVEGGAATRPLGRAAMTMADGRTLLVELGITPVEAQTTGVRAAIVYDVTGHAAEPATGYEIQGRVVVDRKTLAFLSIEVTPTIVNVRR